MNDNVVNEAPDGGVETPTAEIKAFEKTGMINPRLYVIANPKNSDGEPLLVDGRVVDRLEIRKPKPAELAAAGIKLQEVGVSDIATTLELLKIQCEPHLGDAVYDLDLPVLTEAAGANVSFFTGMSRLIAGK